MLVYYSLYLICLISSYMIWHIKSKKTAEQKNQIIAWVCFLFLAVVIALRHQTMGVDLRPNVSYGYLGMYETIGKSGWDDIIQKSFMNYEKGYVFLNKLLNYISHERQFLLISCSIISIIPIGYVVSKRSSSPLFSFVIYMGLPLIQLLFSGLRQDIAIGITFLSIEYIRERKPIKFFLLVLLATTIHTSAIIFLVAYPAYHFLKLKKRTRLITIGVVFIVYIFRTQLFGFLSSFYWGNVEIGDTGAVRLLLLFLGIYAFCTMFSDDSEEQIGLLNIFFIACIFQCFAGVNTLVMRIGFYFMTAVILLLPNVINGMTYNNAKISRIMFMAFFGVYGLIVLHSTSYAMSYPYYFFWQNIA